MKKYVDLRLLQILTLFYTTTTCIQFLKKGYLKVNGYGFEDNSWSEMLSDSLIDWVIVMAFMSIIAISAKIMIEKKVRWSIIFSVHLFFSLFIGIIIYFLSSIVYLITGQITFAEIDIQSHFAGIVSVLDLNFLIYFSMISIVYSFFYFQKTREAELEKVQLANQLTNTKMNVLKYKLHPHFLFNTLNSISSLIESNKKLAQNTIADLGDLLRDLLNMSDANLIPLEDEINISQRYLDIMSIRFSDHLSVRMDIEKNLNNHLVPSLILLPIIENSIKHGYSYDVTSLKIIVSIQKQKNKIIIQISNNGAKLKEGNITYGHGLGDTIDRLKILYHKKFTYSMKNGPISGVITRISFPSKQK